MGTTSTNKDGLVRHYGTRTSNEKAIARAVNLGGVVQQLVLEFDYSHVGLTVATFWDQDLNNDGVNDSPSSAHASLPALCAVIGSRLYIQEVFDSAGDAAALNIGTYKADGTVIDADGVDEVIPQTSLDSLAAPQIICNGALIGTGTNNTAPSGSSDAGVYIGLDADTEVFTAGKAMLVIEYVNLG